jgi:hypothetical protein
MMKAAGLKQMPVRDFEFYKVLRLWSVVALCCLPMVCCAEPGESLLNSLETNCLFNISANNTIDLNSKNANCRDAINKLYRIARKDKDDKRPLERKVLVDALEKINKELQGNNWFARENAKFPSIINFVDRNKLKNICDWIDASPDNFGVDNYLKAQGIPLKNPDPGATQENMGDNPSNANPGQANPVKDVSGKQDGATGTQSEDERERAERERTEGEKAVREKAERAKSENDENKTSGRAAPRTEGRTFDLRTALLLLAFFAAGVMVVSTLRARRPAYPQRSPMRAPQPKLAAPRDDTKLRRQFDQQVEILRRDFDRQAETLEREVDRQVKILMGIASALGAASQDLGFRGDEPILDRLKLMSKRLEGFERILRERLAETAKEKQRADSIAKNLSDTEQRLGLKENEIQRLNAELRDKGDRISQLVGEQRAAKGQLEKVEQRLGLMRKQGERGLPRFLSNGSLSKEFDFFEEARLKDVPSALRLDEVLRQFMTYVRADGDEQQLFTALDLAGQKLYELMMVLKQSADEQFENACRWAVALAKEGNPSDRSPRFSISVKSLGTRISSLEMEGGEPGALPQRIKGWVVLNGQHFTVRKAQVE